MNILYIHGLNSLIQSENNQKKINFLSKYGSVFAPQLDYEKNQEFKTLKKYFEEHRIDLIIGSSMGGYMAFHLSKKYKVPALLFNPALFKRSINQIIEKYTLPNYSIISIILGMKDDRILPEDTIKFLKEENDQNYNLRLIKDLGHQIPFEEFQTIVQQTIIYFNLAYQP